jgi:hypothetical protein
VNDLLDASGIGGDDLGISDLLLDGDPTSDEADAPAPLQEGDDALAGEDQADAPEDPDADGSDDPDDNSNVHEVPDGAVIRLGDTELPFADLVSAYEAGTADPELINYGRTYGGALARFGESPQGAAEVIDAMIAAAVESYGDTFDPTTLESTVSAIKDLDDLTPREQALLAWARSQRQLVIEERAAHQKTLKEVEPVLKERQLADQAPKFAAQVNKAIEGAKVTPDQIVKMMREQGETDPVKAYKLATFATRKPEATAPRRSPNMPRGNGGKTFDPNDRSLSADAITRMMEQGYVPIGS